MDTPAPMQDEVGEKVKESKRGKESHVETEGGNCRLIADGVCIRFVSWSCSTYHDEADLLNKTRCCT
jgi:hypothetical protein